LSNGKRDDISLFRWRFNEETGKYEPEPIRITPEEFWQRQTSYQNTELFYWNEVHHYYDDIVLDAIDMCVDDMQYYPEARQIINYIKNNLGEDNED